MLLAATLTAQIVKGSQDRQHSRQDAYVSRSLEIFAFNSITAVTWIAKEIGIEQRQDGQWREGEIQSKSLVNTRGTLRLPHVFGSGQQLRCGQSAAKRNCHDAAHCNAY